MIARADTIRPLTVCLISEEYPPESGWGGIGTYSYNHARSLAAAGHRVHVIAQGWGGDRVFESEGVIIHRLTLPEPTWRTGSWFVNLHFPESRQIYFWCSRARDEIRKIMDAARLDVVESPEYHAQGLLAAMGRRDVPMVVKLHTPAFVCRKINGIAVGGCGFDTLFSERSEQLLVHAADLVTSPSRALAAEVAQCWPIKVGNVRVIPYAMDAELFARCDDEPRQSDLVQYVGRIEQRKGVVDLIDAMPLILRRHPRARLRLIGGDNPTAPGGGSMKQFLIARAADLGVPAERIEFVAHVERTLLPRLYRQAAVSVVPSRYENFPFTCLESMASACCVVGAAVGGIPEIITHGQDGLLVPTASPDHLSDAISGLLADPDRRAALGEAARASVKRRFSQAVIVEQNVRAYRSVMN